MDVKLNRALSRQIRNAPATARALEQAASRMLPAVVAATPVDTGRTAASTRVEGGHRSADSRSVAARIVQGGAAVQQQFGNRNERTPARQFDRARGAR
jgi:hypothetical protein